MKTLGILTAGLVSATSPFTRRVAVPLLLLGLGLAFVQPCSADSGVFIGTGSLATPRVQHSATLLPNGKVLVAGGLDSSFVHVLVSAELYDPATGTWTPTGDMRGPRRSHTAILLPNGKVFVDTGRFGFTNQFSFSEELYDPASGTWAETGPLTRLWDRTATLLPNGKVLLAGGDNVFTTNGVASAELYDPASETSTPTGSLGTARTFHTATLLANGKVLVTGGLNSSGSLTTSAELYDPASGTWTATGSVPAGSGGTATLLPNGKVLLAGGAGALYDPASGTWTATGSLGTARTSHTATLLPNGNVLFAGGSNDTSGVLASAELYVPLGAQLLNISTRMRVLTDPNQLIGGFIITGPESKKVLILATGPSLAAFGIPGVLANPTLELFQDNTSIASNDDWKIPAQAEIEATGLQPSNELESALVRTLAPGNYTAIVRGTDGGTGVGTVQVFDLAQTANSKLANISSRGFVDTGDNVMIAGFILGGNGGANARVVIRAIGPSLNPFLSGALQDPTLELKDTNGATLRSNDDWKNDGQQAEIEGTGLAPTDNRESALVTLLPDGQFTAIVRGKSGATGVAVVQVYNLQ